MKLYKYKLVLVAALIIAASSCQKDKLNPVSSTSISDANAFDTPERISKQVDGLYASIKSGNLLGGRYFIYNDVRGENFINEKNNGVTALLVWNFTVTGGDNYLNSTWNDAYLAINRVNVFLEGMQTKGNTIVGDELAKQYEGEAKFTRAIAYYSLLQLYAPPYRVNNGAEKALPLRLTAIKESGKNDLERSTVAEVYAQVLSDLNDAETNLPLTYDDATLNTIHAHRNTAIALKTRVYLSMNDYANVVTEANKIVSASAPFKASSGVANALESDITKVFASYTTTESVFSMPFTGLSEEPGTQNQLGYYYLSDALGGSGEYSLNTAGIIADASWKAADKRRSFINETGAKPYLTKFPGESPYIDWVPVMRYSEVLLNLAEAKARTTNAVDAQAVALLNAVRNRSDASTTYTTASFASATELIAAILKERDIEFLGEGLRSPDILRLGLTFPAKSTVKAVTPADPGYIWPAPTSETQYNSLW